MLDRKQQEAFFHDERERLREEDPGAYKAITGNKKFYSITRQSRIYIERWLATRCPNHKLLDYCCGRGGSSIKAASYGAEVTGIDISEKSIQTSQQRAIKAGVDSKTSFLTMDAENLEFEDNTFDLIICSGVLHHLDVARAFPELSRVLKPSGEITCIEALGYNPLINWYRKRTPQMRTAWEADHILTLEEVDLAKQHFGTVKVKYFHLASLAAVPFRNLPIFDSVLLLLEGVDSILLSIPIIQKQAWQMIFTLSAPR